MKSKTNYGSLSKKEREYILEYGQRQSEILENDEGSDFEMLHQRVVTEEELDRGKRTRDEPEESDADLEDEDEMELAMAPKKSAYEQLLKSLQSNSKNKALWKRKRQEESGKDEEDVDFLVTRQAENAESSADEDQFESDTESSADVGDDAETKGDVFDVHFGREAVDSQASLKAAQSVTDDVLGQCIFQEAGGQKLTLKPVKIDSNGIKNRLRDPFKQNFGELTPVQGKLMSALTNYSDIMITKRSSENSAEVTQTLALHCLNHVFKTRDKVLKNNEKLKANPDCDFRDQGFTRPKVLVLLPLKNNALEFVDTLIRLSNTTQQENKKRFKKEFSLPPEEDVMDTRKPADYRDTFAGNIDDCFRVGIKLSRKTMKLYSEFYSSDILVASPLGLRMIIGSQGDKQRDFDFLSSIEVVIMDQADVMFMQNWEHVRHVFEHLNLIPKEFHDTDFSRVRPWYLDGNAKYLRQNVICSQYALPDLNTLWKKYCLNNVGGKLKIKQSYEGSITQVAASVEQIFNRIPVSSMREVDDARFMYFTEKSLPALRSSILASSHVCIVIPSYVDFLRLKNWMATQELSFAAICEYTSTSDISRARARFFNGNVQFLLVTERFHFYRRYHIRGIHQLVFYAPVYNAKFYSEFVNMVVEGVNEAHVSVLYTVYDALALERIVGSKRVQRMITSDKQVFMFTV